MYRNTSYLIIRELERWKFRIKMKSKVTLKKMLISAIAFVDNTDLVTKGDKIEDIMNQMLGKYDDLCAVT